jgi:tetratricopeptide (TPR) repeat protein
LNRPDEAINCFKAALDLDSLSNDRQNTALCYQYLGRSFLDIEDFASAKEPLKKARELYQADGQVGEVAETDRFLARILIHENKLEKAKRLLKEVRAVEQALYQRSNMQTKLLLATVHLKQKNYEEAEKLFRKCYQVAIKLTNGYAKMGVEAGLGLADALDGQERHEDANQVRLQVSSVVERRPDAKESDEKKVQEIEDFIKTGEPDLALAVAYDLLEEKNELGEISGHWLGIYHATRALWSKDDFQGIVDMFSNNSKQGLEFQDDIVIPLKNMVTHALSKVGRIDDALKLNEEVLADARLGQSLKETAYAHENRARILKKMRKADAYKFQKLAVKEYLELGDSTRALSLLQYWEEQRKKRWDNY